MFTRRPLFASLLVIMLLAATPAQAVVLSADIFRDAALRYELGQGVEQDQQRAFRLYCIAALRGDAEAARQLGLMYTHGQSGVNADRSIAAGWFRYAKVNGDKQSGQQLEQLARRVVEQLSETVVRDIAWEAVPEIAERLIRERIREIEEEAESSN